MCQSYFLSTILSQNVYHNNWLEIGYIVVDMCRDSLKLEVRSHETTLSSTTLFIKDTILAFVNNGVYIDPIKIHILSVKWSSKTCWSMHKYICILYYKCILWHYLLAYWHWI